MIGPGYEPIEVPAGETTPGRRSLLANAPEIIDAPATWIGGFTFRPDTCEVAQAVPQNCGLGTVDKVPPQLPGIIQYEPWQVVGADECSTVDRQRPRVELARRQLLATRSHVMEAELWDGAVARDEGYPNPFFAADGVATDLGEAGVTHSLAALEQGLADCLHGQRGMIHATPFTAALWLAVGAIRVEGGRLLSPADHIVVAGSGYSGSPPGDPPTPPADLEAAANAYATGMVYVLLGPIDPADDGDTTSRVDRAKNTETVFVEQPVAAVWSGCCLLTVTVDHTSEGYA